MVFLLEILVKKYQIWTCIWKPQVVILDKSVQHVWCDWVGLFTKPRLAFFTCQSNVLSTWLVVKLTLVGSFFIATRGYLITTWLVKPFTCLIWLLVNVIVIMYFHLYSTCHCLVSSSSAMCHHFLEFWLVNLLNGQCDYESNFNQNVGPFVCHMASFG